MSCDLEAQASLAASACEDISDCERSLWRGACVAQCVAGSLTFGFQACALGSFALAALAGEGLTSTAAGVATIQALGVTGCVLGALGCALGVVFWPPTFALCLRTAAVAAAAAALPRPAGSSKDLGGASDDVQDVARTCLCNVHVARACMYGNVSLAGRRNDAPASSLHSLHRLSNLAQLLYLLVPLIVCVYALVAVPSVRSPSGRAIIGLTAVAGSLPIVQFLLTVACVPLRHAQWFSPAWVPRPSTWPALGFLYNLVLRIGRLGRLGEGALPNLWAEMTYQRVRLECGGENEGAGPAAAPNWAWVALDPCWQPCTASCCSWNSFAATFGPQPPLPAKVLRPMGWLVPDREAMFRGSPATLLR